MALMTPIITRESESMCPLSLTINLSVSEIEPTKKKKKLYLGTSTECGA